LDFTEVKIDQHAEQLELENKRLLDELELAYQRIETILEESNREKEVTYRELQHKFETLEKLYAELSKKENLLIHMEKLSSIGEFIAELIHELNNPLTAIRMQAELALMKDNSDVVGKQFKTVLKNSDKMINLLERFRSLAYKSKEEFQIFDLNESLVECCETVAILKPKKLVLKTKFTPGKLLINGDLYQINQVVLNLSKNAFDALNEGESYLKISTKKMRSAQINRSKKINTVQCMALDKWAKLINEVEEFALIEVSDNGVGMPPQLLKSIFDAFFTTKERGKGTGLGLSISKDIALRHGGNLTVESVPGKGTTFQFFLPLVSTQF
jgi:signal transduction histidine kinase